MIKIKNIINTSKFLTLSTCYNDVPWISTVEYWIDCYKHFYFVSRYDSIHVEHILKNNIVSFTIKDDVELQGLQVLGYAEIVKNNLFDIVKLGGNKKLLNMTHEMVETKLYDYKKWNRVVVKITVIASFVNVWNGKFDYRIRCKLNDLLQLELIKCKL